MANLFPDPDLSPFDGSYHCGPAPAAISKIGGVIHFTNVGGDKIPLVNILDPLKAALDAVIADDTDHLVTLDIADHVGGYVYMELKGGEMTQIGITGDGPASAIVRSGFGGATMLRDLDSCAVFSIAGIAIEPA